MHRGHDHDHDHHGNGVAGAGHNHALPQKSPLQWQTLHDGHHHELESDQLDVDLVEKAFIDGFRATGDPTSFLRLAHVPFDAKAPDGARLVLLRVETEAMTDVGAIMPHLGGGTFRYDPLPAGMVARRQALRFVYFDGYKLRSLRLADIASLGKL
jgi:hypothetical protein